MPKLIVKQFKRTRIYRQLREPQDREGLWGPTIEQPPVIKSEQLHIIVLWVLPDLPLSRPMRRRRTGKHHTTKRSPRAPR